MLHEIKDQIALYYVVLDIKCYKVGYILDIAFIQILGERKISV